jgi:hypothetical protein
VARPRNKKRDLLQETGYLLNVVAPIGLNTSPWFSWYGEPALQRHGLFWSRVGDDAERHQMCEELDPVLFDFIRLRDAPDVELLQFGAKWGPLGGRGTSKPTESHIAEPVRTWRQAAAHVYGVLLEAALLRETGTVPADLLQAAGVELPENDFNIWSKNHIGHFVKRWVDEHRVSFAFEEVLDWTSPPRRSAESSRPGSPSEDYGPWSAGFRAFVTMRTLGQRLGIELVAALTQEPGIYRCSGCGTPYWPRWRRPSPEEKRYCPDCARKAELERKSRYYNNNRDKVLSSRKARRGAV